jgi:hypothetical protein
VLDDVNRIVHLLNGAAWLTISRVCVGRVEPNVPLITNMQASHDVVCGPARPFAMADGERAFRSTAIEHRCEPQAGFAWTARQFGIPPKLYQSASCRPAWCAVPRDHAACDSLA